MSKRRSTGKSKPKRVQRGKKRGGAPTPAARGKGETGGISPVLAGGQDRVSPGSLSQESILHMQQHMGNTATQQVLSQSQEVRENSGVSKEPAKDSSEQSLPQSGAVRASGDKNDPSQGSLSQFEAAAMTLKTPLLQTQGKTETVPWKPLPTSQPTTSTGTNGKTASPEQKPTAALLPKDAQRKLLYAQTTLRRVKPLDAGQRKSLEKTIPGSMIYKLIKDRDTTMKTLQEKLEILENMAKGFGMSQPKQLGMAAQLGFPMSKQAKQMMTMPFIQELVTQVKSLSENGVRLNTMIQAALPALKINSESELVTMVTDTFPKMFMERAKKIALVQLDQNKELAQKEIDRYKIDKGNPQDIKGLRAAAIDLKAQKDEIATLEAKQQTAKSAVSQESPKHGPPTGESSSQYDVDALGQQISEKMQSFLTKKRAYSLQYPVLFQDPDLGALAQAEDAQLSAIVGNELQVILDHIEKTKKNIQDEGSGLKVWNMPQIVAMTKQDLGIDKNLVLEGVVDSYVKKEKSKTSVLDIALTAISITAGIIATVAATMGSGGLALIAGGVALVSGGILASKNVKKFLAVQSAQNVAMDPTIAQLTKEDPGLFWLITDLVGVGLDAVGVGAAFKALRGLAKAGKLLKFGRTLKSFIKKPADYKRVMVSAARNMNVAGNIRKTLQAIGKAFRKRDLTVLLGEIKRYANKGFYKVVKALKADGKIQAMTAENIAKHLGADAAEELITTHKVLTWSGFYDPHSGIIFVKNEGSLANIGSFVVHEAVHHIQAKLGQKLLDYSAEFQSFWMQRDFLKRMQKALGSEAIPDDVKWLVNASDLDIEFHIVGVYGYVKPSSVDHSDLIMKLVKTLRTFP